mmetsp:Transcript_4431/g.13446  ORF Transcript_4431/g.13446 Transcript_4431/m.13446 type:complete len:201 (+) Transcript_4431:135-737(+)
MASSTENVTDEVIGEVAKGAVEAAKEVMKKLTPEEEAERKAAKEKQIEEALNCPCIDRMKEGPCAEPFIAAYRCFLESEATPQGGDCYDQFLAMHTCIQEHPEEYKVNDEDEEDLLEEAMRGATDESPQVPHDGKNGDVNGVPKTSSKPDKAVPTASAANGASKETAAVDVTSSEVDLPKEKTPKVVSPKVETGKPKVNA